MALSLLVAAFLPAGAGASARNATDAGSFVSTLAQDAIDQLAAQGLSDDERGERFRKLFTDGFDVPLIARFVLGRYWRQATEAERDEYLRLFDELVVQTYARRFNEFNTARLRVDRKSTRLNSSH